MKRFAAKMLAVAAVAAALSVTPNVSDKVGTNVTAEAAKVKLNKKKETLTVGQKTKLKVKGLKKGTKVTWSSSKKKVASVSKKGVVTAKKAGKAVITAKVGSKKYKCKITVTAAAAVAAPTVPQTEPAPVPTPETETPQTEPVTTETLKEKLVNYIKENATVTNESSDNITYSVEKQYADEIVAVNYEIDSSGHKVFEGYTAEVSSGNTILGFDLFKMYDPEENSVSIWCVHDGIEYGVYDEDVNQFTTDSRLTFSYRDENCSLVAADEETNAMVNGLLQTAVRGLSEVAHEAGVSMSDLGYSSYGD